MDWHDPAYLVYYLRQKEQMHLPFKAQDAAQKKRPIKLGGFCHLCRRAKKAGLPLASPLPHQYPCPVWDPRDTPGGTRLERQGTPRRN